MSIVLENIDCNDYLKTLEPGSVDLILEDPPFGCTQNDWDIKPDFSIFWPIRLRVIKKNGAMIFFATQPFASEFIMSMPSIFRYDIIWYKQLGTGFLNAKKMPLRNHEHILVFYKNLPVYNAQMSIGKMKGKGRSTTRQRNNPNNYGKFNDIPKVSNNIYYPESVIDFSNGNNGEENDHPTQKPLTLIRYLVKTYSNYGDIVFDGYSGSGTTAIACIEEQRNFIGCELKKEYYENARKRIDEYQLQTKLFQ